MPTGEVRKLGEVAVWKGPDPAILRASSSLDSFENFAAHFLNKGTQMK